MRLEVHKELAGLPAGLPAAWNALLGADHVARGADATASFEWHASLLDAFLGDASARLLLAYDDDGLAGVLPLCRMKGGSGRLAVWSELYCGRSRLVLHEPADDTLRQLVAQIDRHFPDWRCLELTLSDGNDECALLQRALGEHCLAIVGEPLEPSPFITLPEHFDDYFKTLKGNFRTEVGRGMRRLGEQGRVERRLFTGSGDVAELWQAVCTIERQSWKEPAGTSITTNPVQARFYEALLPRAAVAGQLFSTVLYLDGRPIAHQLCLRRDATGAILKMSYVEDLKRHYPATVLLVGYIRDMIENGLRFLDFMGLCDDFKMRWTDETYGRTRYLLYRRSLAGRLAYWRRQASQWSASRRAGAAQTSS